MKESGKMTDLEKERNLMKPTYQELVEMLAGLVVPLRTIRDEQASDNIFGGRTTAFRRANSLVYAARITKADNDLDDALIRAEELLDRATKETE